MLYDALQTGGYRIAGNHKPNSKRLMGIIFRADPWEANKVYRKYDDDNYDIMVPPVYTGLIYRVKNPGKSGATAPTLSYVPGEESTDGALGLTWEGMLDTLMPATESISSVAYTCTHGVTVSSTSNTGTSCQFMIDALPDAAIAAGEFEINVLATKSNTEKVELLLKVKVGD